MGGSRDWLALLHVGKLLIGLYLGKNAVASIYGATGSLVVIVVWVYYSSQIRTAPRTGEERS
jgi:uncharacterized BrkB/YihY/UPF0761 family membrane protein